MCDTEHDDPGLQPADLLRRHTEQQEIIVIPIETAVAVHRTRIARKSGAWQASFLAHLGSVLISKPVCGEVSPHEPGRNDPAHAREKDIIGRQCEENPFDNTSDEMPKLQVEESTSFWAKLRSPSTQSASRGQRALGLHLGLVPSRDKRAKMSPLELVVLIWNRPRNMCQKVTV